MNSEKCNEQRQAKKPYKAPEVIEHGDIQEITGFDSEYGCSGKIYKQPA